MLERCSCGLDGVAARDASETRAAAKSRDRRPMLAHGLPACRAACGSASSTTACSPTPSAAPSAGTATSPSGWPPTGHEVTYLTLRQWDRGASRRTSRACACVAVGPRMALYTRRRPAADRCRRSSSAPACCGTCCATARRYDVVHTASFPYFSLLAAAARAAARGATGSSSTGTRCGAATTGASTSGALGGRVGCARPARCACACRSARSASRACTRARLREEGLRGEVTVLEGEYAGPLERRRARARRAGGRVRRPPHPREARARARAGGRAGARALPELRGEIFGDGPERAAGASA